MNIPYTTLKNLRRADACIDRYIHLKERLGKNHGDEDPIALITILDHNGLKDVLWIPDEIVMGDDVQKRYRLFAVACCQDILCLMKDQRSRDAVKASHLYSYGEISMDELAAAWGAAWGAAWNAAGARQAEHFRVIFSVDYSCEI